MAAGDGFSGETSFDRRAVLLAAPLLGTTFLPTAVSARPEGVNKPEVRLTRVQRQELLLTKRHIAMREH
eukprot:6204034-Pleurochrysis_carterae.AAC.5